MHPSASVAHIPALGEGHQRGQGPTPTARQAWSKRRPMPQAMSTASTFLAMFTPTRTYAWLKATLRQLAAFGIPRICRQHRSLLARPIILPSWRSTHTSSLTTSFNEQWSPPQADGAGAVAGGGGRPWPLARTEAMARRIVARRRTREDIMVSGLVVAIVADPA